MRPPLIDILHDMAPEAQLSPWQVDEIRAELQKADATLAEARKLAGLPEGRPVIAWKADVLSTDLPLIQEARGVLNLLRFDAAVRAQEKDADGSLTSCRAALDRQSVV